jgi:serine protease Do
MFRMRLNRFVALVALSVTSMAFAREKLSDLEFELQELIDRCQRSVVTVSAKVSQQVTAQPDDSILPFFRSEPQTHSITYFNVGTGIVFDREGHIVTRSSIVDNAESITVTLWDEQEVSAVSVARDYESGFSVLKVEGENLEPVALGDSDEIRSGSMGLLIGNSLGVFPSIAFGPVNGLTVDGMIQISLNLNPGNNGSPILNLKGEVVGVVAGRLNTGDDYLTAFDGYHLSKANLVYPINWISRIVDDLLDYGHVRKGWLGVVGSDDGQARIKTIKEGSPALEAGMRPEDVIVGFSNRTIRNVAELARLVQYSTPGTSVPVTYLRNGEQFETEIMIGERPEPQDPVAVAGQAFLTRGYMRSRFTVEVQERNELLEMRVRQLEDELEKIHAKLDVR